MRNKWECEWVRERERERAQEWEWVQQGRMRELLGIVGELKRI